jgi:crotonobetainyl-CoA:carnitine CoA-transferase CaiB-like acyl-CoA transferase
MTDALEAVAARVWRQAGGPASALEALTASGPRQVLPSYFDVTGLATGVVAAATLAAAGFQAARNGTRPRLVTVDSREASASFAAEALFTPVGWDRPRIWDPIAGNYQATDGWIRLHTNYAYHRAAVERVLGARDKDGVAAAAGAWKAADLEAAVVEAGGCAAVMHSREAWLASPAGAITAGDPPLSVVRGGRPVVVAHDSPADRPYAGIRVLDLTRVIAGPVATRFLAAYGADVLRVDPPGFEEVAAVLPESTAGKHAAALDLTAPDGRAAFEGLLATADVLVTGLRANALDRLGYGDAALAALNPALIIASLDAYGWDGPWRDRRGFDSLVQMSCGIAAAGAEASGKDKPVPLPVQALDHATGYLVAAAVGLALTDRLARSAGSRIRASLISTANLLWSLPRPGTLPPPPDPSAFPLEDTQTAWGPARRVALPGRIAGTEARWSVEAGPLGRHAPAWAAA